MENIETISGKNKSGELNIPILILFFNRPEPLKRVFEQVKLVCPKKLYLFQDGARKDKASDIENVELCRRIIGDIDWNCEVHRFYSDKNMGCDPAEYASISWVLRTEEMVIRLEDDNLVSTSYFKFCEELLNKYKNDKRVFMITGRNQFGSTSYKCGSYFFTGADCISGLATWRDRWELVDPKHDFLNDEYLFSNILSTAVNRYEIEKFIDTCRKHREITLSTGKIASYESAIRATMLKNHMLQIVPQVNMIQNIGMTADAVHSPASFKEMLKEDQWLFKLTAQEIDFPLQHPESMVDNIDFYNKKSRLLHRASKTESFWHFVRVVIKSKINKIMRLYNK